MVGVDCKRARKSSGCIRSWLGGVVKGVQEGVLGVGLSLIHI